MTEQVGAGKDSQTELSIPLEFPSENGRRASAVEAFEYVPEDSVLVRTVLRRDGSQTASLLHADPEAVTGEEDLRAVYDRLWLREPLPPDPVERQDRDTIRVVDLFSGCGGMTLGIAEACRALGVEAEPVLAVDIDREALDVYRSNFPDVRAVAARVEDLLDGELGQDPTENEQALVDGLGEVDVLVGGPPCQGNSDLNNHTRRTDPKNALFRKMARFAELFSPQHVIVENVHGILHDSDDVFYRTRTFLDDLTDPAYDVDHDVVQAEAIGVAQNRHRVFLVASRRDELAVDIDSLVVPFRTGLRTFDWACGDLADSVESGNGFDAASTPAPVTKERIDYLHDEDKWELPDRLRPPCHRDKDHNYPSVYGRMWSDRPAPTITTGFTAMGQGRFVHPDRKRTITPHEAARLQFFPDFFRFGDRTRNTYKTLIGNAVPPKMTYVLGLQLLR